MNKIQGYSRIFRYSCVMASLILAVVICTFWYGMPAPLHVGHQIDNQHMTSFNISFIPSSIKIMYDIKTHTRWLGLLITLLNYSLVFLIFYYLTQLFRLYEANKIFVVESVKYIRKISLTLLLLQLLLNPLSEALMTWLLSLGNPAGHRFITVSFAGTNFALVITAVIILFVSFIMQEGCQIQDEIDHTV